MLLPVAILSRHSRTGETEMTAVQARDSRIVKARELILSHSYLVTAGAIFVYSDTPGVAGYTIEHGGRCSCPDAAVGTAFKLGVPCKHEAVAKLLAQSHVTEAARMVAERETSTVLPYSTVANDEEAWLYKPERSAAPRRLPSVSDDVNPYAADAAAVAEARRQNEVELVAWRARLAALDVKRA